MPRDVITVLGAPNLWCMEHGAHITCVLVEARIYIAWMAGQDALTAVGKTSIGAMFGNEPL